MPFGKKRQYKPVVFVENMDILLQNQSMFSHKSRERAAQAFLLERMIMGYKSIFEEILHHQERL